MSDLTLVYKFTDRGGSAVFDVIGPAWNYVEDRQMPDDEVIGQTRIPEDPRIKELGDRLKIEQRCNHCDQYHGKDVCQSLLDTLEMQGRNIFLLNEKIVGLEAQLVPETTGDKVCVEDDGCPTERAVLQRVWREQVDTLTLQNTKLLAQQAKIDALMLEYCPDEMTEDQVANWERHQVPAEETLQTVLAEALVHEKEEEPWNI
jgi:hypothetical protein